MCVKSLSKWLSFNLKSIRFFITAIGLVIVVAESRSWAIELTAVERKIYVERMSELMRKARNATIPKQEIKAISQEEKEKLVQAYLDYVIEKNPNADTERNFTQFVKTVDQLSCNQTCKYFYNCIGDNTIANVDGINIILEYKRGHGKIGDAIALPKDDFVKGLNKASKSENFDKTFIVWHGNEKDSNKANVEKHVTPVFIRKVGKDVAVFITDSIGETKPSYTNSIIDLIESSYISNLKHKVYYSTLQRQKDSFSCPAFSILDAEEHHRNSLFEHAKKNSIDLTSSNVLSPGEAPRSITINPKFLFKEHADCSKDVSSVIPLHVGAISFTQSFTYINEYFGIFPEAKKAASLHLDEKAQKQLTVEEMLNFHRYMEYGNTKSGFVRKKAYRYYGDILKHIVAQKEGADSCSIQ